MQARSLAPAAQAFDAIAPQFDTRFRPWLSVEAQRNAVRRELAKAFPAGSRLIEIGGGTGEDALWLAENGREVLLTDPSPAMLTAASAKCGVSVRTAVAGAEDFGEIADQLTAEPKFDGAYSIFAGLNCVADLAGFGTNMARLLDERAPLMLVVFGTCCPGEILVETLRGRPRNALRRFRRGEVPARLGEREFVVHYHRCRDLQRMLWPSFRLESRRGIGIFVPPSAAEPWISSHPRLLGSLERLDRALSRPFAALGDHVLYRFVRTDA